MAVQRPTVLGAASGLANGSDLTISPGQDESIEVQQISHSGKVLVKIEVDEDDDGAFEVGPIEAASLPGEDQLHAVKELLDGGDSATRTNHPKSRLVITNDSGSTIDVEASGVVIT